VDSWYDKYLGIVILVRIFEGEIKSGLKIKMMATGATYTTDNVGYFAPKKTMTEKLTAGEVGFITAGIKDIMDCQVGDTITEEKNPCASPLKGFRPSIPVVFCGIFPVDTSDFDKLRDGVQKLHLNDSSFSYEVETSAALGFGFRCGFLGLLHLEIIQERLEREFNIDIITTAPSVVYHIYTTNGNLMELHNPAEMPEVVKIDKIEEPWIRATVIVPETYLGNVLALCEDKRGEQIDMHFVKDRAIVQYYLPLNEVVFDFYDKLKSSTKGYASFDYQASGYREGDLVKVSILINGDPVDALSMMIHKTKAEKRGRALCIKLKDLIPKQLFKVAIQAAIGGKVIARETVSAYRKDVLAKCYGGDITRKRKLLDKQKEGKKRMKQFGNVEIPHKAFIEALKISDD
jgi:GTP-binding protein LepA